jgi:hypothetical protein
LDRIDTVKMWWVVQKGAHEWKRSPRRGRFYVSATGQR